MSALTLLGGNDPFSGKWNCDKNVSTLTADIPDGLRQEVKRKGGNYQIITVWREPHGGVAPLALLGIMATEITLTTDGAEKVNQVGPFMQRSASKLDGNQLVTQWTATVNGQKVNGKWTRVASDDGKTFTLEIEESMEDGKTNNGKLVFTRN